MSRQITQPVNQVRLTNVAVVRMQTHGKRFEIACYRNKIVNYRQGIETDLEETLQTDRIFTNVSKGQFAKSADLKKCFGTTNEEEICKIILMKGSVQVSDMERSAQLEATTKEVASMLAAKCVDPASNRPYTVSQIRDAMQRAEFCVHPTRSVKQQFLDCVKLIKSKGVLPIERAKMELCIVCDTANHEDVVRELKEAGVVSNIDVRKEGDSCCLVILIDPSLFRTVDAIAKDKEICGPSGRLEILQQCVTAEGDVNLASEVERKNEISSRKDGLEGTGRTANGANEESDKDIVSLVKETARAISMKDDTEKNSSDDDGENDISRPVSSRRSNKKAQKKSKKAKRREKEEAAERQERVDAEKARQAERAARLGLDADVTSTKGTGTNGSRVDGDTMSCNTCGGSFTPAQYRAHFRSDWHRYNIKLKMSGAATVSEEEFKLCDVDAFFE